jgi:hypothetical protein
MRVDPRDILFIVDSIFPSFRNFDSSLINSVKYLLCSLLVRSQKSLNSNLKLYKLLTLSQISFNLT